MSTFEQLPDEMKLLILSHADLLSFYNLSHASPIYRRILKNKKDASIICNEITKRRINDACAHVKVSTQMVQVTQDERWLVAQPGILPFLEPKILPSENLLEIPDLTSFAVEDITSELLPTFTSPGPYFLFFLELEQSSIEDLEKRVSLQLSKFITARVALAQVSEGSDAYAVLKKEFIHQIDESGELVDVVFDHLLSPTQKIFDEQPPKRKGLVWFYGAP